MPKSLMFCEAAIVGGGPAGAATGILLAQAGREVVLFEKEPLAHDKVCGEFLSWEATHYLRGLGIDLPSLGAQAVSHLRLINGHDIVESVLSFPAWSLSRRVLDEALLELAQKAGVTVRRGDTVTGLTPRDGRWEVSRAYDDAVHAQSLFLAAGKHEVRGWRREDGRAHELIGFKMHFELDAAQRDALRGCVEIILFNSGYAGLELVENDRANLCFLVDKNIYASRGKSWDGLLAWLMAGQPHLAERLRDAVPVWPKPLTIYKIPYGYVYKGKAGDADLFRLGDQMAVIPSFAGDGISIALHSAHLAAQTFLSGQGAAEYHRSARRSFLRPVRNARFVSRIGARALSRNAAFTVLHMFPQIARMGMKATRLGAEDIISSLPFPPS